MIKIMTKQLSTLNKMVLCSESPIIDETMISKNPGNRSVNNGITRVNVEMKSMAVNNNPMIDAVYFPSMFTFIQFYL
jgi:hypothetical protein